VQDIAVTWSGRTLDVGAIESELDRLRFLAAGQPDGGNGFAARASVLNMVVYAEHEDSAAYANRVIEDLAENHPSRVLTLVAHPGDEESRLEAELAAHCHLGQTEEQRVCCEEVTLRVWGRAARHLHSVAIPLLVPDLPVYVWWTEKLPEDEHTFHGLLETADRLVIDSGRFEDGPAELACLARLAASEPEAGVGDLNWRRITAFRELLRNERRVTDVRHHLQSVESVEVSYADGRGMKQSAQALLIVSWLARELGWGPGSALGHGPQRIEFRTDERRVAVYLRPVDYPAIDPGSLVSFKVSCQSEDGEAFLAVSRTGDPSHVTIRTEHRGQVAEASVRIEPPQPHELLMDELDAPAHDPEYRRVLGDVPALERALRGWA
jgi:glucose-6-phosphate dehydrogenase assembly protein OpcA